MPRTCTCALSVLVLVSGNGGCVLVLSIEVYGIDLGILGLDFITGHHPEVTAGLL